jgi:Cu(I)/Ag(I) efflux system membrane protein CusA/SilA
MMRAKERLKIVIPLTLLIVIVLLYFNTRNVTKIVIVLLAVPFSLIGAFWLIYLLGYNLSVAVWVGIIALVGLAAQTGIVMIVYIDNAFAKRKAEGRVNDLSDIVAAVMEGTVQRVRPKLMTVATMLIGLVPLLWADTSGADVMKRIAAPMVGGLVTSAFLTLEIIPVVYTYWRNEELLWQRAAATYPAVLARLRLAAFGFAAGAALLAGLGVCQIYVTLPAAVWGMAMLSSAAIALGAAAVYLVQRPAARRAAGW